ncbi:MAG: DUF3127 domain-containing protein [Acutalibacteraceae bacterium]|nr:DUF3127 domain-containing protein [Acutalibacteraceae bacterium]
MEIQGKVIAILEPQRFVSQKNGNEYVTTVFVIETQGQYPKKVAMKVMGEDKFKQMGIVMGGTYNVSFDVESREWKGKYYTECQAWRTQRVDGTQEQTQQTQTTQQPATAHAQNPFPENNGGDGDGSDNIPF